MSTIALKLNTTDLTRTLRALGSRAPKAIARAINRSVKTARTVQVREMAKALGGLTQKAIGPEVKTSSATPERLSGQVSVTGRPIPLVHFKATGPEPSRGRGRGVSYRIGGKRKRIEDAFLATMASGHRGVFRRAASLDRKSAGAWSKNLPIVELHGPSLPEVFAAVSRKGLAAGQEALRKNLTHELRWALEQSASS